MDDSFEALVRDKLEKERWTHKRLRDFLQSTYPGRRGLSLRSIRRFCQAKRIFRTSRPSSTDLDIAVSSGIAEVGPTYGRKSMTGLLASKGLRVSEARVGQSLKRMNPGYHQARQTATARQMNPVPYHADYFGHKLHVDQNEKLVMYGVTHICAIDGYSGKVVGFISMPVKNNVEIYTHLYQQIVQDFGLWDQIRVDQGKEWVLMLYVQETLAHLRRNTSRPPHLQSTSKQNHCIERMWVEINTRVNYPLKACLVHLEANHDINMDCDHIKFCVSWFTIRVSSAGARLAVESWNEHPIPGRNRGIPNVRMRNNNQCVKINLSQLPEPLDALQSFEANGGQLTVLSCFGNDPLKNHPELLEEREHSFYSRYADFKGFFSQVVNGDYSLFREGLLYFIDLSHQLQAQISQ